MPNHELGKVKKLHSSISNRLGYRGKKTQGGGWKRKTNSVAPHLHQTEWTRTTNQRPLDHAACPPWVYAQRKPADTECSADFGKKAFVSLRLFFPAWHPSSRHPLVRTQERRSTSLARTLRVLVQRAAPCAPLCVFTEFCTSPLDI